MLRTPNRHANGVPQIPKCARLDESAQIALREPARRTPRTPHRARRDHPDPSTSAIRLAPILRPPRRAPSPLTTQRRTETGVPRPRKELPAAQITRPRPRRHPPRRRPLRRANRQPTRIATQLPIARRDKPAATTRANLHVAPNRPEPAQNRGEISKEPGWHPRIALKKALIRRSLGVMLWPRSRCRARGGFRLPIPRTWRGRRA
jgi:hypothetical protein